MSCPRLPGPGECCGCWAAVAGLLLSAEPVGAREVRDTAGPLWPPRQRCPGRSQRGPCPLWSPSGVVPVVPRPLSLQPGPLGRGPAGPGGKRVRLSALGLSAAAFRPAGAVGASPARSRLFPCLRTVSSRRVRCSARNPGPAGCPRLWLPPRACAPCPLCGWNCFPALHRAVRVCFTN